jgi:predicted GIY-YIG superfamily endonuclease
MIYIYKLYFEHEPNVCYIGKTGDLEKRMKAHKCAANTRINYEVSMWINRNCFDKIKVSILEKLQDELLSDERERFHIKTHKENGFILVNKNNGGTGRNKKAVGKFDENGNLLERFNCLIDAAKSIGRNRAETSRVVISKVCNKCAGKKTAYGFIWKYLD